MKLGFIALIAICSVSASLPAFAMPIAPLASSIAPTDLVQIGHGGHGDHYGWHHGHGHHYGWYHGHHHGWRH